MSLAPALRTSPALTPRQLLSITHLFADEPRLASFADADGDDSGRRWYQLARTSRVQVWGIYWPAGSATGWHDHGEASGAFLTVSGTLTEHWWRSGEQVRQQRPGVGRPFTAAHIHNVRNTSSEPAISVHAYSPVLDSMTRYDLRDGDLWVTGVDRDGDDW